ncbi:CDP-diacylglycerol--serine O-phosphatidyltransferase [uncultured Bdellovibrio sp.]|uniref:CDP-diacylglycerol--serine O-phosphatidyltransferase n=1 Tax=Bdellovibrio sp. HCB-162 TaxID=3394234 RepID=UPI0025DE537A|nr:CDP-diacylglycerol--serine O-phosphatidyltransferase [uncultured Bdellovibrio sp.]
MAIETQLDSEDVRAQRLAMYIYILPNLMTTGNLFSGFFAVIQSIKGNYLYAAYAIVVAAVFDQLDGRLARLTRSTSKFGAEYDSLCDLVSFGMAPGVLLFLWALQPFGRLGWVACFLFVACGALRLARFNVQANVVEKNYFQGLPIPMAAGIVASSVLAFQDLELEPLGNYGLLIMTILLALVMVSNFRFRSFKDLDLKERLPFRYLILGVGVLVVVALRPEVMLFVLFMGYAALGAVFGIFRLGKNIRKIKPSVYAPAQVHESDLVLEEEEEEAKKDEKKT